MSYEGLNEFVEGVGIQVGKKVNAYCSQGYYRSSSTELVVQGSCSVSLNYDGSFGDCLSKSVTSRLTLLTFPVSSVSISYIYSSNM